MLPLESLRLGGQVGVVHPNGLGPCLSGAVTPPPHPQGTLGFRCHSVLSCPAGSVGTRDPGLTRAEAWQAGPPGMTRACTPPAPSWWAGWMGCRQRGRLLTVPEKVNERPAAVGPPWMCWRQGTARSPLSAGACSPGLLGLALLWRNSSVLPGTLPAARTAAAAKCLSSSFPENQGLGRECLWSSGCSSRIGGGG